MYSDKKLTMDDTWRPADLKRHIRDEGHGDGRRREDSERKHRGGESKERHRRDPERESRRERDKPRESTRERRDGDERDRYTDRRKEGSHDSRGDKEKDRRDDRDREKRRERDTLVDGKRYDDDYKRLERERDKERHRDKEKEKERDRERHRDKEKERERDKERHRDKERERQRDKERHRDKEKDGERDRERRSEEDRDKRREERDRERRREERDREHRAERERRRGGEEDRDLMEKHERDKMDRHKERERHKYEYENKRNDKERRERHGDGKHSEVKEEREHRDEQRRHKERGHHDEKRRLDSKSRENQDTKGSGEEVRRHHGDRERVERDKHIERRHRVEEEEEGQERNHHRDKTSSKKSDKSHKHETKTEDVEMVPEHQNMTNVGDTEEPVASDTNLTDQEYEDDFEDYEEDFEEMDESANEDEDEREPQHPEVGKEQKEEVTAERRKEIEAIQRAMDEENERVGTAQSRQSTSREEEERPKWSRGSEKTESRASHRGKFIDFVAAKQREVSKKVATKQKKRSTELLRLIDLDFSMTTSLLDLPPVNEYDMYIRTFGTANTKQAYVQCNEDDADRDIQTDEIEVCEKWTQHPPEHNGACGDPNLSQEARDKSEINFDSQRLTAFLRSASQAMVVLLEEDRAERKSLKKLMSQTDTLSFSDGSLQLNTKLPFLIGRRISLMHLSQVQKHTMMSVHSPMTKPSTMRFDSYALICIWNIWEPSRPQRVLVYESELRCCCFSPGKATLVFAGTSIGSIVLWDLREQDVDHYLTKRGEWTYRLPTFSTDAVRSDFNHFYPVMSVEVVPSAVAGGSRPEVPLLASEEESSGLSFQLASLDEIGVLNFWVVVELPKADKAGSLTDLGLRPGGKVKLLHSSRLLTAESASPRDAVKTAFDTLHLKFLPTDSNHFLIGTSMGLVKHETNHSVKARPKFYNFQEGGVRPVDVTSIHFSPFRQQLFLVGGGDGSIRLHAVSLEHPVAQWWNSTAGEPVVSLQWTQTRPAVFCVLDAASNLHIWDLLKNDSEPVVTERLNSDRVTAMAVFGDSGQQNTYSGIALAHESGKIKVQHFTKHFTVPITGEEEKLERMISEAF